MKTKSEFYQYMESLGQPKIFFDPLKGNHGDRLIRVGAEYVLQKLGVTLTEKFQEAEYIVINGGGYFNKFWGGGNKTLRPYRQAAPEVPIIMGPQTYKFTDAIEADFREICQLSSAPIILFARERISYNYLCQMGLPKNVEIKISPDFAFELEDSPFIQEHQQNSRNDYILVCMRLDRESSSLWIRRLSEWKQALKKLGKSNLLSRVLGKTQRLSRPWIWRSVCNDICNRYNLNNLPHIYKDVSLEETDFESFCNQIEKAAFIITERLHVGVLGYLLNKPVVLVPNPNYHKVHAIYEYSMKNSNRNVSLYELPGEQL
ncbi:MAG: polysaccharide pyruvyl transferase family protein [Microcoleaceae cyanobacterium MO_207.B10]|nr:polysaccharide pyruvyl transferase family protein [Microcoleaceae cyanobacterium MO_207.B10]